MAHRGRSQLPSDSARAEELHARECQGRQPWAFSAGPQERSSERLGVEEHRNQPVKATGYNTAILAIYFTLNDTLLRQHEHVSENISNSKFILDSPYHVLAGKTLLHRVDADHVGIQTVSYP